MRYVNQISSMYSVVIKVFNHIAFVYGVWNKDTGYQRPEAKHH